MPDKERENLRGGMWRESVNEEVSEELSFHVEMRARELASKRGISLEEARRTATARFGDIGMVQAECEEIGSRRDRDMKRTTFWSEWSQDARYALRQLRTAPGLSLLVIATLALGIGASTTIFSVVNAVVLRPFSFPDHERVIYLTEVWKGEPGGSAAVANYEAWRDNAKMFEDIAAMNWGDFNISTGDAPERVQGIAVTANYFRLFRAQPAIGRTFTAEDDREGAPRVVILAWSTFERRFNADRSLIGRDIIVNNAPAKVIGVMPKGFDPMLSAEELWVPASFTAAQRAHVDEHYLFVVGRLKKDAVIANAQQELNKIAEAQRVRFPRENAERGIAMQPVREILIGNFDTRLYLLLGAVLAVLLIACANVANLLLGRSAARQGEFAVRAALGAGRGRIFRQLITENLILALVTVVVSIGIAMAGVRFIAAFAPAGIPRIAETSIDPIVLAFALVTGICSSLIFGLAPALRAMNLDLQTTLRIGGRDSKPVVSDWLRSGLITLEVALSVLLLIGAGLLIRTSLKVAAVDPGFRTDGVVMAQVTLSGTKYADPDVVKASFENIVKLTAARPGVQSAAAASQAPLGPGGNSNGVIPEGRPLEAASAVDARLKIISPEFMKTMDIEMEKGRAFDARDTRGGLLVTIVSRKLAEKLWPGEDPIGKRIACCEGAPDDPMFKTVVGVASDVRTQGPTTDPRPEFYLPLAQTPAAAWDWLSRTMTIVASGSAGTDPLVNAVRSAVRDVEPGVPTYGISTMRDAVRTVNAPARFNTMLLSGLGFLGLVLAAIGIYGVVSYFVNLRTREIGVRIALGASSGSVVRLMGRQALGPVVLGLALGVAAALAATRLLTASLFQIAPTDPTTFAAVIVVLLLASVLAVIAPARRAARVPATQALVG